MKGNSKKWYIIGIVVLLIIAILNEVRLNSETSSTPSTTESTVTDNPQTTQQGTKSNSVNIVIDNQIEGSFGSFFKLEPESQSISTTSDRLFTIILYPKKGGELSSSIDSKQLRIITETYGSLEVINYGTDYGLTNKINQSLQEMSKMRLQFKAPKTTSDNETLKVWLECECEIRSIDTPTDL